VIAGIQAAARQFFQKSPPSHDWSHTQRVLQICNYIGKEEGANLRILELAALLHDIARREEDSSKGQVCHAQRGAELAENILHQYNIDEDTINQVKHCINAHRFRNRKLAATIEAKVLFDADNLDAMGAIGIARSFAYAGEHNLKLYTEDHLALKETPTTRIDYTRHTPILEFKSKLLKIKDTMQTNTGRQIAEKRHRYMIEYLIQFEKEVFG